MRTGKLSPDELSSLVLGYLGVRRPEVLVHAAVGEDAAAIAFGEEACVLSTDPITGAVEEAGWLAVHVACNDVAAMGARPVGVLATVLLAQGAQPDQAQALMADVHRAALELGIEVLGGHTEVAPGLASSLISMTAVGRVRRERLVTSAGARAGQSLVLTKAAGLEGTAILAADLEHVLGPRLPRGVLAEARGLRRWLSVVPEGVAAAELGAAAMHDPTEGGVLGALWELAEASQAGFEVWESQIPVLAPTRQICSVLDADPLRLISSGALLIACPDGQAMVQSLRAGGIQAQEIGRVVAEGRWLVTAAGRQAVGPVERDELWRLLDQWAKASDEAGPEG